MTDDVDPYRYGPPAYPERVHHTQPTGRQIVSASWELLRQDRQLLWLPVISAIAALVASAALFGPGYLVGHAVSAHHDIDVYVGLAFAGFATSVVSIYFQAALVIGAFQRADGAEPTLGGVLAAAWGRKTQILGWALVATVVGAVTRAVEDRLSIVGRLIGVLSGLAWAVATMLVVPVLVAERVGPLHAVRTSARLVKRTWGSSLRTNLRVGVGLALLMIPLAILAVAGGVELLAGNTVAGAVLLAFAAAGFAVLVSFAGAITAYAQAMIYRYATGQPVPGIPHYLLAGALTPRRRWWKR